MTEQSNNKRYWLIGIMALVSIASIIFVWLPSLKELKKQTQEATFNINNLKYGAQYIADINKAYQKYKANENIAGKLMQANPASADAALVLAQLNGLAKEAGLQITALTPTEAKGNVQTVTVNASGDYGRFRVFLKNVEKSIMPVKISRITVSSYSSERAENQPGGNYEVELTIGR